MPDVVLLVDDDPPVRKVIGYGLRRDGFEVVEAENGEQAINLIKGGEEIDVLVTDVRMPGLMDGGAVASAAREAHPEMPVVIMSGETGDASFPDLGKTGAFLQKPFSMASLIALIHMLLAAYRMLIRRSQV